MCAVQCLLAPGPIGKSEHTNEELVNILKAKGCSMSPRLEAALLLIPRDLFVPRDRHREAFRCGPGGSWRLLGRSIIVIVGQSLLYFFSNCYVIIIIIM